MSSIMFIYHRDHEYLTLVIYDFWSHSLSPLKLNIKLRNPNPYDDQQNGIFVRCIKETESDIPKRKHSHSQNDKDFCPKWARHLTSVNIPNITHTHYSVRRHHIHEATIRFLMIMKNDKAVMGHVFRVRAQVFVWPSVPPPPWFRPKIFQRENK